MIVDKRGIHEYLIGGVGVVTCERLRVKDGGVEIIVQHTMWIGGMGYLRKGKWIRDRLETRCL